MSRQTLARALAALLLCAGSAPAAAKPNVQQLLRQLRTSDGEGQLSVIRALGRTGKKEASAALLAMLDVRQDSPRRCAVIVESLGRLKDRRAVDALINAWDHLVSLRPQMDLTAQVQVLRGAVLEALGELGGDGAGKILLESLSSETEPMVLDKALRGLARMRERKAIDAIAEFCDRGGIVGQAAFEALGMIGDERSVPVLERGLRKESAGDQTPAAYGLALMGRTEGLAKLLELLKSSQPNDKVGVQAAYYLAKLDNRAGIDYLAHLIGLEGNVWRGAAVEALGKAENPRAAAPLVEALEKAEPPMRVAIARSLGRLEGSRAIGALKKLKEDSNITVRAAAGAALQDLGEY